jgi:hypothetical protein
MFRLRLLFGRGTLAMASSFLFNRSVSASTEQTTVVEQTSLPYQHVTCTGFDCIRQSSMLALTASSSFLKQTLFYYSELTHRYCVHIASMITILEEFKRHEGQGHVQEELWAVFVQERLKMNEMKSELLRLRLLLSTIDRLVNEAIDASYQTLDETVSQLVNNELNQAKQIIRANEELLNKSDTTFTLEHVKLIEMQPE